MARNPQGGGRRKTAAKKIENEKDRAVTFTKRHHGLFKKANELATLCGVQIAIILFSLSGKPLSFGSPSVPFVINKYLNSDQVSKQPDNFVKRFVDSYKESKVLELNQELDELNEQIEKERKRGQMLQERLKALLGCGSYDEYIAGLGVEELVELKSKLENLKKLAARDCDGAKTDLSKIGAPKDFLKM